VCGQGPGFIRPVQALVFLETFLWCHTPLSTLYDVARMSLPLLWGAGRCVHQWTASVLSSLLPLWYSCSTDSASIDPRGPDNPCTCMLGYVQLLNLELQNGICTVIWNFRMGAVIRQCVALFASATAPSFTYISSLVPGNSDELSPVWAHCG